MVAIYHNTPKNYRAYKHTYKLMCQYINSCVSVTCKMMGAFFVKWYSKYSSLKATEADLIVYISCLTHDHPLVVDCFDQRRRNMVCSLQGVSYNSIKGMFYAFKADMTHWMILTSFISIVLPAHTACTFILVNLCYIGSYPNHINYLCRHCLASLLRYIDSD